MKTKVIALLLSVIGIFILTGCVAKWGKSYNVAMANSRSVVIEYDPLVVNLPAMLQAAQAECAKYGKDAVLDSRDSGNLGIKFRVKTT